MKITRKQLKRIIAEEHAVVYGTKPKRTVRRRKPVGRKKTRKQYLSEARQELLREQRAIAFSNQVIEEGFGSFMSGIAKGIGKIAGGASEKAFGQMTKAGGAIATAASNAATAAGTAITDLGKGIADGATKAGETIAQSITDEIVSNIQKLTKQAMSRLEKEYPDKDENEMKAFVAAIIQKGRAEAEKELQAGAK